MVFLSDIGVSAGGEYSVGLLDFFNHCFLLCSLFKYQYSRHLILKENFCTSIQDNICSSTIILSDCTKFLQGVSIQRELTTTVSIDILLKRVAFLLCQVVDVAVVSSV